MSDPIERLRNDARHGTGPDRPDLTGSLTRIHERTAGYQPGGLTRQKRARAGAWGVAGVGAAAAAGLVVAGVTGPGASQQPSAGPSEAATHDVPTGTTAVAYLHRARTVLADVDLDSLVLSIRTTDTSQDVDGAPTVTTVRREALAGDGSASRAWVPSASGRGGEDEEVRRSVPGQDRVTTWWVSPEDGVYTQFVADGGASDKNPSAQATQPRNRVAALGARLGEIEKAMSDPGVRTSGPTHTTIDGKAATCVTLSGDGSTALTWLPKAKSKGTVKDSTVLSWSSNTCFDDASNLPLVDTYTQHRDGAATDAVSRWGTSASYRWLPRNAASEKLVAPDLDGLRKVGYQQYIQLTK